MRIDGRCHCGYITYEAEIDLEKVMICHCGDCQTLSDSALRTVVLAREDTFKLLSGKLKIYDEGGESGTKRSQSFCPECGAPIYSSTVGEGPKIHSIRVGTARQRDQLVPKMQLWCRSSQRWLSDLQSIPRTETQPVFDRKGQEKPNETSLATSLFRIEDFLTSEEHQQVLAKAIEREVDFKTSTVLSETQEYERREYRKSVRLDHDPFICPMFQEKIRNVLPEVTKWLGVNLERSSNPESISCQITAHRDGGFYHVHTDSGTISTANRVLSYVYYFQSRPRAFFGGELKLYEPRVENGVDVTGEIYSLIAPKDNSIIFFPSHMMHEVLPTYVPSGAFSDSRFTVNGWIRTCRVSAAQSDI